MNEAIGRTVAAKQSGEAISVGWLGNAVDLLEALINQDVIPDVLTDQTSAHDPLNGYYPQGLSLEEADALRLRDTAEYVRRSTDSMTRHVKLMIELKDKGAETFDYGNNIRQRALDNGLKNAFDFPGFVPAYIRPQFCLGRGPFRWVALSGDPADIAATARPIASFTS